MQQQQFDRDTLGAIFDVAMEMEKIEKNSGGSKLLQGYLMATLFYEPSTRTRLLFESAMKRLGGEVLTTEKRGSFHQLRKGRLSKALLDVHTIKKEIGKLDGITVGLVGDLVNGRTVGSLAYLLAKMTSRGVEWEESSDLSEVASKCDVEVDADPRAAYFRQAKNGLYIRMALLKLLLLPNLSLADYFLHHKVNISAFGVD